MGVTKRVCFGCGLPQKRHGWGDAEHPWEPVAVEDVPTLPHVAAAIRYLYEHAMWLDYPAARLLEATARQTRVPRPLLDIAFAHEEARRGRRPGTVG